MRVAERLAELAHAVGGSAGLERVAIGGLCEMVVPGRTGWLTRDTSVQALIEGIG